MSHVNDRLRSLFKLVWLSAVASFALAALSQPLPLVAQSRAQPDQPGSTVVAPRRATDVLSYTTYLPYIGFNDTSGMYGSWAVQIYDRLDAASGFDAAVAAGVRWMRMRVMWSDIEPVNTTPANYQWSTLDTSMQAAQQAGANIIVTIEGNPRWAAANPFGPVTNLNDFKEFVGALVTRYPQVTYWELYNEPDNILHFGGKGAMYAAHLNAAYTAIKANNPAAKVVMGGIALDWYSDEGGTFDRHFLADMLTACAQPCFDIANFHYYPVFRANWEAYGRDIIGKTNGFRQKLAVQGYQRPVMSTETGWVYGKSWGGPDIQARYVPKTMVRSIAAGLLTASWYAMVDADPSLPGFLGGSYPSFNARPAYSALNVLYQELRAARYQRALNSAETGGVPNLEGYVFTNYGGAHGTERVDVAWYDCPSLIVGNGTLPADCLNAAPYTVSASKISVVNHVTGVAQIYTDGGDGMNDGKITLVINTSPVYIHYQP
jgi:hypothetical protein